MEDIFLYICFGSWIILVWAVPLIVCLFFSRMDLKEELNEVYEQMAYLRYQGVDDDED